MLIIQALFTALLSGLFSGTIIFALNERRDRANLMLSKVEETVQAYSHWVEEIGQWPNSHFDIFFADDGPRAAYNRAQEIYRAARVHEQKARFLQEIYLPSEGQVFELVVSEYREFILIPPKLFADANAKRKMTDEYAAAMSDTSIAITHAGRKGLQQLYKAARNYAHAPYLIQWPKFRKNKSIEAVTR